MSVRNQKRTDRLSWVKLYHGRHFGVVTICRRASVAGFGRRKSLVSKYLWGKRWPASLSTVLITGTASSVSLLPQANPPFPP